jgi:hypothetical protein
MTRAMILVVFLGGCAALAPVVSIKGPRASAGGGSDPAAEPASSGAGAGSGSASSEPPKEWTYERHDDTEGPDWISVKQKRRLVGMTIAQAKAELLRDGQKGEIRIVTNQTFDAHCAEDHVCSIDEPDGASLNAEPFNLYVNRHVELAAPPP